jgi:dynein light chain roadblock-type
MSQKVEETLNRINTHMGVLGVMIVNQKGVAIKSTMPQTETIEYGSLITQFYTKALSTVKSLHPEEDITFIRIRSNKHEIMIAPDREFSMIVLQNPSNDDTSPI